MLVSYLLNFPKFQVILSGSRWRRAFWFLVLFFVLCIVSIQLRKLTLHFASNPTMTNLNLVFPKRIQFPEVTICTLQKYNKTKLHSEYPKMRKVAAEFSTSSFFSAYSTALMDLDYFGNRNLTLEELEAEFNNSLNEKSLLQFIEVRG